jgi:hypothetical protein
MSVVCASILSLVVSAAPAERLAIVDFDARGVDQALADNLVAVVAGAVRKSKAFEVTTKKDIEKMLKFEESKQLAGGTASSDAIAHMANTLGIAKLMNGSLGRLGSQYVLTLNVMDTQSARVIASDTTTIKANDDSLVSAAEALTKALLAALAKAAAETDK